MSKILDGLPEEVALCLTQLANESMLPGGQYDPFKPENFGEAMVEAGNEQFAIVASHVRANDCVAATAAMHLIAREYWFDYACSLLTEAAFEQAGQGGDNPCEMEAWERELPIYLQYQAH